MMCVHVRGVCVFMWACIACVCGGGCGVVFVGSHVFVGEVCGLCVVTGWVCGYIVRFCVFAAMFWF